MPTGFTGQGLSKSQRLLKPAQFQAVYQNGRKAVRPSLILWSLRAPSGPIRLGVVAGLKVGDAVRRNRARRMLREVFRRERDAMTGPADAVLVARRSLADATLEEVRSDLLSAARRTGLLRAGLNPKDAP